MRAAPGAILALVTDAFGAGGGIGQYNRDFLTALQRSGQTSGITVLARSGRGVHQREGLMQYPSLPGRLGYVLKAFLLAARRRPALIFCGHIHILPLAWLLSRLFRCPLWLQLHGIDAWQTDSRLIPRLVRSVDLVSCVSRYTRGRFLAWADIPPSRVRVLPNTVSAEYSPAPKAGSSMPTEYAYRTVLLSVGRMSAAERYKGHDRVIECLPRLSRSFADLIYLIAGDGNDRQRLMDMVRERGLTEQVRFLGAVEGDRLQELYQSADLFVLPSTGEGFGIVYLEAMACGLAALGLDQDGSRDPLMDGQLGFMATTDNLCLTIDKALRSPRPDPLELRARVMRSFGWEPFESHLKLLLMQVFQANPALASVQEAG